MLPAAAIVGRFVSDPGASNIITANIAGIAPKRPSTPHNNESAANVRFAQDSVPRNSRQRVRAVSAWQLHQNDCER